MTASENTGQDGMPRLGALTEIQKAKIQGAILVAWAAQPDEMQEEMRVRGTT
ncbi:hypothetical protein [Streptomyces sp. NPDC055085]